MSEITIGQYYYENSIVHKLDPRVKMFGTMLYVIALFCVDNYAAYATIVMLLGVVIVTAKVKFIKLLKGLKGILFIILMGFVFNVLFYKDGNILWEIWKLKITDLGIINGVYISLRIVLIVMASAILTFTTKPSDLADGLEKSFGFLNKIKVPVHEIAMIISLALRFIPTLMSETEKITKAQKARGAKFDGENILERVKSFLPLLVPLFVSAINRALELSVAMESRCYTGGKRTKLYPLCYKRRDYIAYIIYFFVVVIITALYILTNLKMFNCLKLHFHNW